MTSSLKFDSYHFEELIPDPAASGALAPWLYSPDLVSLIPGGKKQKHSRACDDTLRMQHIEIIGYSGVSDIDPEFGKSTLAFSPPYLVGKFRFLLEFPFLLYLL